MAVVNFSGTFASGLNKTLTECEPLVDSAATTGFKRASRLGGAPASAAAGVDLTTMTDGNGAEEPAVEACCRLLSNMALGASVNSIDGLGLGDAATAAVLVAAGAPLLPLAGVAAVPSALPAAEPLLLLRRDLRRSNTAEAALVGLVGVGAAGALLVGVESSVPDIPWPFWVSVLGAQRRPCVTVQQWCRPETVRPVGPSAPVPTHQPL